jgi:hypothetical protein
MRDAATSDSTEQGLITSQPTNHSLTREKMLTALKTAALVAVILIPPALATYWILILSGVRRYDANLLASTTNNDGLLINELIACDALSNPSMFQQWESIVHTLSAIQYFCKSDITRSQLLSTLENVCNTFKSSVPCDASNGGTTDFIQFCGNVTMSDSLGSSDSGSNSENKDPSLASITCQDMPIIDGFVKYFAGGIAALFTLVELAYVASFLKQLLCCELNIQTKPTTTPTVSRYSTFNTTHVTIQHEDHKHQEPTQPRTQCVMQ